MNAVSNKTEKKTQQQNVNVKDERDPRKSGIGTWTQIIQVKQVERSIETRNDYIGPQDHKRIYIS